MSNIFDTDPSQSIWDDPSDPSRTSSPLLGQLNTTIPKTTPTNGSNINPQWGLNDTASRDLNSSIWGEQPINHNILTSNDTLAVSLNGANLNNNNNTNGHVHTEQNGISNRANSNRFNSWMNSIRAEFSPLGPDTVLITEIPEKEGLLFKHTNYLVENLGSSLTDNDDDPDASFGEGRGGANPGKVIRRYSDFFWLFETLLKKYPFRLIPELPPKSVGYSNSETVFMEKRVLGIRRFMNQIVKHPVLGRDELVLMFLSVPTDLANWRKNAVYNQNEEFLNQRIDDSFVAQWDEVYIERWNEITQPLVKASELWKNMTILIERFEKRLEMYQKDEDLFTKSITRLSQCLPGIYSIDNSTTVHEITDGLTDVVKGYSQSQQLIHDKRSSFVHDLHVEFKKFGDYLQCLMNLIERYKRTGGNQIPGLNLRTQQLHDKLRSFQGKPEVKGNEVDKVKDEITRIQKEIEIQTNRDWLIKKVILHEFVLFQETQFQVSDIFKKLIAANLKFDELYSNSWNKIMADISDMPAGRN
ncbi:hypothetical protein WICPIJ_007516 [Wickerhamomyces pijperi]|uniref:Sorting nexin MVP1 n=1 Tax=Wickerhamomyces pijperi TaxID=599730 RepID=A0A9P8Q1J2_WICPI|nr:hypothetical protein WICPIJ_007516 [Wickerhamomyces pijperi]